jgi:hypothetical protein
MPDRVAGGVPGMAREVSSLALVRRRSCASSGRARLDCAVGHRPASGAPPCVRPGRARSLQRGSYASRFILVPHEVSFLRKIVTGLEALTQALPTLRWSWSSS